MIFINIGKTFLQAYNQKYSCNYSAKEFFVNHYFKLFFDHEKYMQWVTNSPFVQGIKKGIPPTPQERAQKLLALIDKISNNEADASIAIGYPSIDIIATTSGQMSNLELPFNEEDVYLSWIGGGFGLGVKSGLSILFNDPQILLDIFEGWKIYRDFLNKTPNLRGNQINTWNGAWLAHRYNTKTYDPDDPIASFNPFSLTKDGELEVETINWPEILVGISRKYSEILLTGYVYSLGQTNITVGFIPFNLPKIKYPYELYEKYFGTNDREIIGKIFGTAIGFTQACQCGSIGVNALEPQGFRECFNKGTLPKYDKSDDNKIINYKIYQIWLLAMLNNEQLWDKAKRFAEYLDEYSKSDKNAKKTKSQEVSNLLGAVNKRQFIDKLTNLVKESSEIKTIEEIASMINIMPIDNVPYFLTLIRFHYAIINKTL